MPHPEKRDLDLIARRLRDWLSARLPGAQDLRVSNLRAPSDTGFSSETLLFALDYRSEDEARHEELVVRLEPRGLHVQQACRARMGDREGVGLCEQIVIGSHAPSGFKELLDGAA